MAARRADRGASGATLRPLHHTCGGDALPIASRWRWSKPLLSIAKPTSAAPPKNAFLHSVAVSAFIRLFHLVDRRGRGRTAGRGPRGPDRGTQGAELS